MKSVSNIYDSLFEFESKGKSSPYPIHKRITVDGRSLLHWVCKKMALKKGTRILDAGCGTGYTLFWLHKQLGISGVGLSISGKEIDFAQKESRRIGVSNILFYQRNFAQQLDDFELFDNVIAIESIKHSEQPLSVIENLLKALKPGGKLAVADDFLLGDRKYTNEAQKHINHWLVPGFTEIDDILTLGNRSDFSIEVADLTKYVPLKPMKIQLILIWLAKASLLFLKKSSPLRINTETYIGGLLLEYLYSRKEVGYYVVVIKKEVVR